MNPLLLRLERMFETFKSEALQEDGLELVGQLDEVISKLEAENKRLSKVSSFDDDMYQFTCLNNGFDPNFEYNMYLSRLSNEHALKSWDKYGG